MQSIYNQEIFDNIKRVYPLDLQHCIGWKNDDIECIEKHIFPNKLPQAIKDFLLLAGNKLENFDFRVMSSLYVMDFYRSEPDWIKRQFKAVLGLEDNEYIVFFYYVEGQFVCFCKLGDNNPNPPVFKTDYEIDAEDLFVVCAVSFTQFIVDLVLADLKFNKIID
jgi:hypothetical protein